MAIDDGTLARVDALRILARWTESGEFPDRMLGGVPPFRRPFVMDLVYTTVRRCRALAFAVDSFVSRRPDRPYAYEALLMGAAQVLEMHDVAEYAAVGSTVEAYKTLDGRGQSGLLNAVLRNLLRNLPAVRESLSRAPLAVRTSHTDGQVARWVARFGTERAEALLEWDDRPAAVTLLPLPGRTSAQALLEAIRAAGVDATPHPGVPDDAIVVPHGSHVDALPGFAEGLFTIQDPATLEATRLLDARPGMRVLDACAAPGGKTCRIAAAMEGRGELFAADCWRDRLAPLRENLRRLRFDKFAAVGVLDAKRATMRDFGGPRFDRILADVPCSNSGVQRRRADARWRFDEARIATLAETQGMILENLATGLLAPGGRIVYSTCSLEPEENERVVEAFLARHRDFALAASSSLVPPDRECDGAYAAALVRNG